MNCRETKATWLGKSVVENLSVDLQKIFQGLVGFLQLIYGE
jgi:hypothetical protein